MPLADLLEAIQVEADEELAALEARTRAQADAILADADARAEAIVSDRVRVERADAEREARALVARASLEGRLAVRAAQEDAWQSARAALVERLGGLRAEPSYRDLLAALVAEARSAAPGAGTLRVDPRDADLARELAPDLAVDATLSSAGGVELVSDRGIVVRNTLEERLANAEPALRQMVARGTGAATC